MAVRLQTTVDAATTSFSFLAKISPSASTGFTIPQPSFVNFGSEPVGVISSLYRGAATIRLSNLSSTNVTSLAIAAAPSVFSESDNCGGQILAGGYCSLTLNFTPNSPVARTGTVTITSSASNSPTTIALSGTGTDSPFAYSSTSSLTFGNQAVGTASAAQTVTITNLGDVTTAVAPYVSTGTDFTVLNNCPSQLAPNASCTVSVTFSPTQAGVRTDILYGPYSSISLTGSGTLSGATTGLSFSQDALQFGPQPTNTTSASQLVYITNSGAVPITVQSYTTSGNFTVSNYNCNATPFQINPQASCYVQVTFSPTSAGSLSGALTFIDAASGSPQSVSLSGVGVQSTQTVEFYPSSSISFPNTPVGTLSAQQIVYLENTGSNSLTVDRVTVSGDFSINYSNGCQATTVPGTIDDGTGTASYCAVYVQFTPTATGTRTGTLTFIDSSPGSPHVVNLTGSGISQTGAVVLNPAGLNFNSQTVGSTSAGQIVYYYNTGNSPVTVTSATSSLADFTVSGGCGLPNSVTAGSDCYVYVYFAPTTSGTRSATVTLATSAGNQTLAVTGTALAAAQSIVFTPNGVTPSSMNLGTIVSGTNGAYESVYFRNTGTQTITFSAAPTITGTNAADFGISNSCGVSNSYTLAANATCNIAVRFSPTTGGAESATLTFADSVGTQTIALSGTGAASKPTYTLSDYLIPYTSQLQGTTSGLSTYIYFYNNSAAAVTLGNVGVTAPFLIPHGYDTCSGVNVAANSNCYVYVEFAPTTTGYQTGTLTFNNSGGTALTGVPAVPLAGYSYASTYTSYVNPTTQTFPSQQVVGTTTAYQQVTLYNSGNTPLTIGTVSGTDLGLAGATAEFSIYTANGGHDYCSGTSVPAASSCYVLITFTPNATGSRTGSISFPVTYANNATTTLTTNLTGTGISEVNAAVVSPVVASFIDQLVGATTTYTVTGYLYNSGNQPLKVGTLANTNSSEFSLSAGAGGYDNCSGTNIAAGSSCAIAIKFTPSAVGARAGTITFPVTFADQTTASPQMTLAGTGVTATKTIQISPAALQFPEEIQTLTSGYKTVTVTNTSNQTITIGSDTVSTQFGIYSDSCNGTNLAPKATCNVNVTFVPGSTSTGSQTGSLTIGDSATGGPHSVALSGIAISASQQIVVSQTTLAFGNQPAASSSSPQLVYFTNQGDTNITVSSYIVGGANPTDFAVTTSNCGGSFGARSTCYVSVKFSPIAGTTGALTATITETDSVGTHTITLTGTAVAAGPAAALNPGTLTFTSQNVHTTSAAQSFSVTNTGSANLSITAVASTNSSEFAVSSDGCSGTVLTPSQHCNIAVQFSPTLGGARSGSITVADNATGSPQSLAVTGIGYGIPTASFSPTSLTFGSQNLNSTSATQSFSLSNPGTDTLVLGSISVTGGNAAEFSQTNTCPASLAPAASCVITVSFTPTAVGTQSAYVTVTDNANNAAGSTQSVPLTGTGITAAVTLSPTSLSFANQNINTTSSAQTITLTNSGAATLTISSITVGSNFGVTSTCSGSMAAGSSCSISVTFKPTVSGLLTGNVTITDNAGNIAGSTQTVAVSGSGVAVATAGVSPATLSFGSILLGSSSNALPVTVSNTGTGPLSISNILISGGNAGDFAPSSTCTGTLAVGSNCSVSVTFTPAAAGSRTSTLYIIDNSGTGSSQSVTLSGTGVTPAPVAGLSPNSLSFSTQLIGTTSSALTVTLSNSGTAALSIASIALGGTNPSDFAQTNNCGSALAVSASCTISVTFTPAAAASYTATVVVTDNTGNVAGSTQTAALSGTGTTSSGPTVVSLSPTSGSGLAQSSFNAVYSDSNGISDLQTLHLLFNTTTNSGANACWLQYSTATNTISLVNNAGSGSSGQLQVGSSASLSNNQCTLSGTGTSVSISGTTVTLTAALTFSGTFTGVQNAYMNAVGNSSGSGWVQEGTWTPSTLTQSAASLSPTSGVGMTQIFTGIYSDPNGASDLTTLHLLFNTSITAANGCWVQYYPSTNSVYLENTAGNGLTAALTPGSSATISNSECTLSGTGTTVTTSGNSIVMTYALSFTSTFSGTQNTYMFAAGHSSSSSNWVQQGTWTPTVFSLTPTSGSGLTRAFTAVYSDPYGSGDMTMLHMLFNTAIVASNACWVQYSPATNMFYLENNAGSGATAGLTPGSSATISNSQCSLTGTGTTVTTSGNDVTITANLTFLGTFTNPQNVYLDAAGTNVSNGWNELGTWTP